ncbi:MAG: hypothetical protein K9N49_02460 [Candidatus Marinimicrobia bacterium]|nr:hypothetical protein [Candidatus Neomarinimicrobiota bacterium]
MNSARRIGCLGLSIAWLGVLASGALADVVGGRPGAEGWRVGVAVGQMAKLSGIVDETKRAYSDYEERREEYAHRLETYSLEEFGLDKDTPIYGLRLQCTGRYFELAVGLDHLSPEATAVARRDYYLGVDKVQFEGQTYDYLLIPEGQTFDSELDAMLLDVRLRFTPFSLTIPKVLRLSPWLYAGLLGFYGQYEIDAGPATGITIYEAAEYEYVIGGRGTGSASGALPSVGLGGECVLLLGRGRHGPAELTLYGEWGLLRYDGRTSSLGFSARNEKDLDLDYTEWRLGARCDLPLNERLGFFVALEYRLIEAEATLEAQERPPEDQAVRLEKYDKAVDLEGAWWQVSAGLRF